MKIDRSIFDLPAVKKSIARIEQRYANDDSVVQILWLRVPWEPGQEPTLFVSDDPIVGCEAIYDPADGELI